MAAVHHLEFSKFGILVTWPVSKVILLLRAKFRVNRTINRWDIPKKRFSIWRLAAILDLQNFDIFYEVAVIGTKICICTPNFHEIGWFPSWDIAKKIIFLNGGRPPCWIFEIWYFWSRDLCLNMIVLLLTEFRINRAINRRDIAKKQFSIWQLLAILDLLWRHHTSCRYSVLCS